MAEVPGIQINIAAKIDELKKALDDAKKAIGSVAQEAEKQSVGIGDPLTKAADKIGSRYGWLAGEIATKLAGLVNPAALAAAAITAVMAGASAYFANMSEKTLTADEALKVHAQLIKEIKKSYEAASEGVKKYGLDADEVLVARNRANIIELQSQLKKLSQDFIEAFTKDPSQLGRNFDLVAGSLVLANRQLLPFKDAIANLNESIRTGTPQVADFRAQVSAVMNAAADNEQIQKLGNELLVASQKAFAAKSALAEAKDEINGVASAARQAAVATEAFNNAIKTLEGIEPKKIDDLTRANNAYNEALKQQGLTEQQRIALGEQHAGAVKRIQEAKAEAAAEEARLAAEAAAREAERFKQREESEKLFLQNSLNNLTLSWGTREEQLAAHLTREQELIDAALEKKLISDEAHKAMMERSEEQHQNRLAHFRAMGNMGAIKDLDTFFKGAQALAKSNGDKSFKTAKAFAIASGVLSTVSAAIQAMNDPTAITPFQKFANYAAVLGKGLSAVASIRGMSPSGGGGGSSSGDSGGGGGTPAGASTPDSRMGQSVYINLQGQSFGRDQVRDLVKQISDFQKDGGQVVFA